MGIKTIGGPNNLGLYADESGGGGIPKEELPVWLAENGYSRISKQETYYYEGVYTFTLEQEPKDFITIYVTDGATSLSSLLPGDYTVEGKNITLNGIPMSNGWWLTVMYTY